MIRLCFMLPKATISFGRRRKKQPRAVACAVIALPLAEKKCKEEKIESVSSTESVLDCSGKT